MPTRMGLVAKKRSFSPQNADENGSRRQKKEFFTSKCRREWISSPKRGVFRPKMMTRMDLVVKKVIFPPQNADEKGCRRQKREFFASKSRRERVSSPKSGFFRLKKSTRTGFTNLLVSKVRNSSNKSDTAD
ncbi:hypothetical protein [Caldibacillus thermoamylovorans]|nr:hypothetical protein [Caldibacillus thermoamylovorans]